MKKTSLAHICAYISLAISITIAVLWCCNVGGFSVVDLASFVGVIVALLAIIVTFVVGWQIYNAIEMKEEIKQLNILEKNLEDKLREQEKNMEGQRFEYKAQHGVALGFEALFMKGYITAFRFFLESLSYAMQRDNASTNIEGILEALKTCVDRKWSEIDRGNIDNTYLEKIHKSNETIRSSSLFHFIKDRYEKIYNSFISKINEENK